ncbi:FitA-like ribbon-helix-helix domain-containing protein [Devosia geojensis]|uniref:FitA-like ribbon-helix-helix domain-containing protein n=1 Tax=Devosia geojensis TaxID=443610 RepID=UPI00128B5FD5|nr:hypothetical protein [Devosia geojensis]
MSIRNIPDADMKALRRLASENKRSIAAEVREAIAKHVHTKGFGTYLHERYGGLLPDDFPLEREA